MIGNNNRKTKRNSPPPLSTTTIVEDHQTNHNKFLKDSFSKWSKVLQSISPPNKKRRAFQEQQRLQQKEKERWSSSSSSSDDSDSSDEESDSDDDATVVNKLYTITKKSISTPTLLRREKGIEDQLNNKQKMLKRRGMYIPPTSNNNDDGPKDAWHQWNLYRRTCQRLRQARLPLLEVIHLRKMLVNLQPTTMMTSMTTVSLPDIQGRVKEEEEEEEDNMPLGTLMEKNKRSRSPTKHNNASSVFETKRQLIPAPSTMSHAIYAPQHYYNPYKQMLHQPCYYYNNTISTYKPIAATTVKFN